MTIINESVKFPVRMLLRERQVHFFNKLLMA